MTFPLTRSSPSQILSTLRLLVSRSSVDAMVATPKNPQPLSGVSRLSGLHLQARDDDSDKGNWGPLQIATPIIVGVVLLLIFAVYAIWKRDPTRKHSFDYRRVRSGGFTEIARIFVPRRTRMRVLHASSPMTLDDSMRTPSLAPDPRRARQHRSSSSDSQTPLTATSYGFEYPPNKTLSDSPPPTAKHRPLRWWRFFGSRPQEIKSAEPGSRWRVDGPDGSSSGHGSSGHGHGESRAAYAALEPVYEGRREMEDDVIRIGENFGSIASTPMTQHFPEQARNIRGVPAVAEHAGSFGARTPVPAVNATQRVAGAPMFSASHEPPPSYDVSQRQTRYAASVEDIDRLSHSDRAHVGLLPPVRTVGYSSPRTYHGRELSTDSFLAAQPPMAVATSIY